MKKKIKKVLKFIYRVIIVFVILSVFNVLLFRFVNPPITWLMAERSIFHGQPIHKHWEDYDHISHYFAMAVIGSEDQTFKDNWGFDVESIEKAIKHNERYRSTRGASTITQQVAKNVFLWPGRTWVRKGFEVYYTVLINLLWSKKRTIEVYMNVVELGDGVYGVQAASERYFHKPASKLTETEAALLAVSLPDPRRFPASRPTAYMYRRSGWVINQMRQLGGIQYLKQIEK